MAIGCMHGIYNHPRFEQDISHEFFGGIENKLLVYLNDMQGYGIEEGENARAVVIRGLADWVSRSLDMR